MNDSIVNISLDILKNKSKTVSKIIQPDWEVGNPEAYHKYLISRIVDELFRDLDISWDITNDSFYLVRFYKEKYTNVDWRYECKLYPSILRDNIVRVKVPQPEPIECKTAEWIVKAIGADIPSIFPHLICSNCGGDNLSLKTPYCPYCGCKMTNGGVSPKEEL